MCESCYGYFLDNGDELIHGKLLCESCSDDLIRKKNFYITNMYGKTFYETIVKGGIFGSVFGIFYFSAGLLKLADDQNKLVSQLKEELSQLEEELSQLGEELSQLGEELSKCEALN